jgi:hypothetical protein
LSLFKEPSVSVFNSFNSSDFPISSSLPLDSTERDTSTAPILSQAVIATRKRGRPALSEEEKKSRAHARELAKKQKNN